MEITFDTFPIFEANQVLTSGHLNEVFDYLDQQARQTRSHLIGIGIACGLDIGTTNGGTTITLSKGCGVTSEGYLITEPEDVALTAWRQYSLPTDIDYPQFKDPNNQYPLWELFADGTPNTTPLTNAFVTGKAMLLFMELKKDSLRNCSPNNCDDKGSEVTATVRRLLIAKSDLDKIIAAANALDSGLTSGDIDAVLSARLNLPDLRQLRFDVPATGPVTSNDVYAGFLSTFKAANLAHNLGSALAAAYTAFQPVVGNAYPSNPFASFVTNFGFLDGVPANTAQVKFLQYYYDLFDDLLRAYDAFRWKGLDLICACCPPDDIFPRHLMLGIPLTPDQSGNYRQGFLPSPAVGDCAAETKDVVQLFTRLVEMAARFTNAPTLPAPSPNSAIDPQIRVTPSVLGDEPLDDKAIPYYYAQNGTPPLFQLWSPQKSKRNRGNQNLGYNSDLYSPAAPAFVTNPLRYDLEPYDFVRVEGHLGKGYAQVLTSLLNLKAQYRLPIDIIALRTGAYDDSVAIDLSKETARFQDLDALYEALRGDLQLALAQGVMELYGMNVFGISTVGGTPKLPLLKTYAPNFMYSAATVGAWYESYLSRFEGNPYIDFDQDTLNANNIFGQIYCAMFTGTANLPQENYAHVVSVYYLSKLSEALPDTLDALAFADFQNKYEDLLALIRYYRDDAVRNAAGTLAAFIPQQELLDVCEGILFSCKLGGISAIHDEYTKRIGDLKKRQFLSTFLVDHPGIQHKAGVPMGGTFILVYHELPVSGGIVGTPVLVHGNDQLVLADETTQMALAKDTTLSQAAGSGVAARNDTIAAEEKVSATPRIEVTKKSTLSDVIGRISANRTLASDPDIGLLLSTLGNISVNATGGFQVAGNLSDTANAIIAKAVGELGDQVVIADFFLPYQISCDCPGIQYVLPKPQPSFTAQVGCTTDAGTAPVTVAAKGGLAPYDLAIDAAAYQALGTDPLQLAPGDHTLMLRDAEGTETPSQSITVAPQLVIGAPAYACDNGNFTASGTISGGTPPYSVNGALVPAAAYATAPTPSGTSVTLTVADADGCSATASFTHTCPPPCTLPCAGIARNRGFRLWLPDPDPNNPYQSFQVGDITFSVESTSGTSVDLSNKIRPILVAKPADLTPAAFPKLVSGWMKKINAVILGTPGLFEANKAQWLTLDYKSLGAGRLGTLSIEYFECLKFNIRINAQFVRSKGSDGAAEGLVAAYTPDGTTITLAANSTTTIPAYDGTVTDKCAGTPPTNICAPPPIKLDIADKIDLSAGTVTLTATATPALSGLTYVWEVQNVTPAMGNGASLTVSPTISSGLLPVVLTAYTAAGCSVTQSLQVAYNFKP